MALLPCVSKSLEACRACDDAPFCGDLTEEMAMQAVLEAGPQLIRRSALSLLPGELITPPPGPKAFLDQSTLL